MTPHIAHFTKGATLAASGALVAAQSGSRIRVHGLVVIAATAVSVNLESGTTDISGIFPLAANGGVVWPYSPTGWADTAAGEALNVTLSAAVSCGFQIIYSYV
jgi:hypothetical protein